MKKIALLVFCTLTVGVTLAQNNEKFFLRFKYSVSYKEYLTAKHKSDLFNLDVGSNYTLYYSHIESLRDSAKHALIKEGFEKISLMFELNDRGFGQGAKNAVKIDFRNKILTDYDKIGIRLYSTSGNIKKINWTILSDTINIFNYKCIKAKATFAGREWIAWFTPGIPVNSGPWKLNGLPGAILKAHDSEEHFIFDCVEISKTDMYFNFTKWSDYQILNSSEFIKLLTKSKTDPLMFIETQTGFPINAYDKSGKPRDKSKDTNLKYNPIERQ